MKHKTSINLISVILMILLIILAPFSAAALDVTIDLKYDRNGNLIQDVNYYYEYNSYNLLSRIRDHDASGRILAEYIYDHEGKRYRKQVFHADGTNTTTYYLDESLVREIGPDGTVRDTVYYYDDRGTLLAREDHDGKKYFYHPDALGSTALVTDEAGNVVEEVEYLPFGEVIEGGNDRYLFTGKEKDRETGLSYYDARFYDPNQAKFIQPDSVQPNVYDPQQLNKYAYARNNPVKYIDEDGNVAFLAPMLIGAVIGASISSGLSLYQQSAGFTDFSQVKWNDVGKSAGVGAVAGATGAFGGVAVGTVLGGGAAGAIGGGAAAGLVGGEAGEVTSNVIEGTPYHVDPSRAMTNAVIGGAAGGIGRSLAKTGGQTNNAKNIVQKGTIKTDFYVDPYGNVLKNNKGGNLRSLTHNPRNGRPYTIVETTYDDIYNSPYQSIHYQTGNFHGHSSLPKTNPYQIHGERLDIYGNKVPANSKGAHWPIQEDLTK